MKLPESLFSRMLLAYLPFMVYPYGFLKAGIAAAWIVAFLWGTVTFFWFTRRLFPERSLKHAFFLWLIVWAQAVWTLTKLPPYWIASVFFLIPVSFPGDTAKPGPVRVFSGKVLRSQYPSIGAERRLEPSKLPFWKRKKKFGRYFFEQVLAGIGFVGFVILLALVREIAEKRLGIQAFEQPAGMLFVAAAVAFLWENQPYRKRSQHLSISENLKLGPSKSP